MYYESSNNWLSPNFNTFLHYLIGNLDSPIYMRQPPSAQMQLDANGRPMICKLLRPLYGLKQSGHIFANVLHSFLCDELGMNRLISDKCAFVKDGNPKEWDTENSTDPKPNTKLNPNGAQLIVLTYVGLVIEGLVNIVLNTP